MEYAADSDGTVAPLTDKVGGILDAAAGIPEMVVKTNMVGNTHWMALILGVPHITSYSWRRWLLCCSMLSQMSPCLGTWMSQC
jgi:hypothetical protein